MMLADKITIFILYIILLLNSVFSLTSFWHNATGHAIKYLIISLSIFGLPFAIYSLYRYFFIE